MAPKKDTSNTVVNWKYWAQPQFDFDPTCSDTAPEAVVSSFRLLREALMYVDFSALEIHYEKASRDPRHGLKCHLTIDIGLGDLLEKEGSVPVALDYRETIREAVETLADYALVRVYVQEWSSDEGARESRLPIQRHGPTFEDILHAMDNGLF